MPNIKSQKKRVKTNEKKRAYNASFKSSMKTAIKKVNAAVEAKDLTLAEECLTFAHKKLDKAQTKGILHKNNVARKKSHLSQLVNTIK
ncbi:small subunit ribosomal protein S20 [Bacilli bacterium PM5-3]|nr:small subunit ribosomal protein S20 [Bacilli bacterium PM5-3]MDH6603118.1 small subunit ribosomal protein S20 [Bacilli bacterium PM5-9]